MLEKLANDIALAAMEKLAAVPGAVKNMRRAKQMLLSGAHDFHGAGKSLPGIVQSGAIKPGTTNVHSPLGLPEVYMGRGKPANTTWMNANTDGIIKPSAEVDSLSFKVPRVYKRDGEVREVPAYAKPALAAPRTINVQGAGGVDAKQWAISPGDVPLSRGNYAVNSGAISPETERGIRNLRLRRMPSQTLADAQFDLQRKGMY